MANFSEIYKDDHYLFYKVKIHGLTDEDKHLIERLSDVRRFTYNYFLQYSNERYEKYGERFKGYKFLSSKLTELRNNPNYSWLKEYNLTAMRGALQDLHRGFMRFKRGECRHPKFKSRKRDQVRFMSRGDRFSLHGENGRYAFIPGLSRDRNYWFDLKKHHIPYGEGIVYRDVHVKFDGKTYWLCLAVRAYAPFYETTPNLNPNPILGADVGVRTAVTLSDGTTYQGPSKHRFAVLTNRLKKLDIAIARDRHKRLKTCIHTITKYDDIPKSKNQLKREAKRQQTYRDLTNLYKTRYHQIASDIAKKRTSVLVLETLRVKKTLQNQKDKGNLSHKLYNARLWMLGQFIEYKCKDSGTIVLRAEDGFKSSQICSNCGHEYQIGPEEIYTCPYCGLVINRDLNAARNLRDYGINYYSENLYEGVSIIDAIL